jgi:CspA family cold shock protein
MVGTVKRLAEKGLGFISAEGLEKDLFFHSNSLVGVTFDELREGDLVNFETELIPRRSASKDTIRNAGVLLPYDEQKIVIPDSYEAVEFQNKITGELVARLRQNPTDLRELTANAFEELIAELYRIDGYTIDLLGSWNQADGGVDILVMKCDIASQQFRMAIQCKRYTHTKVAAAPIRALAGVLDRFHAHAGAIVTTSDFTKPAKKEAAEFFWKVSLLNFQSIIEMLKKAELILKPAITFSGVTKSQTEGAGQREVRPYLQDVLVRSGVQIARADRSVYDWNRDEFDAAISAVLAGRNDEADDDTNPLEVAEMYLVAINVQRA